MTARRTAIPEAPAPPPARPLATMAGLRARLSRFRPGRRIVAQAAFACGAMACALLLLMAGLLLARDFSGLPMQFARMLERESGGAVRIGQAELRYWPRPRIVIDTIRFERADRGIAIRAPRGVIRLDWIDMLDGSVETPHLLLQDAEIEMAASGLHALYASPQSVAGLIEQVSGSFASLGQLSGARLTLARARITLGAGDGPDRRVIEPVEARLRYRAAAGRIDLLARREGALSPFEISASLPTARALANGEARAASLEWRGLGARVNFGGTLARKPEMLVDGAVNAELQDDFGRLFGLDWRQTATNDAATRLHGRLTLDPRGGGLEGLTIRRAEGTLAGIAAMRENAGRWNISATLAGDLVDGSAASAVLARLRLADGGWSRRGLDVNPAPGLDLDIRLSTRMFRLGEVAFSNAALSILTRRDRTELAVNDAQYAGGTVKARLSTLRRENGTRDMRLTASADRVEIGTLLEQAFGMTRLRGAMNVALQAESTGENMAEIAANLAGTGSFDLRAGQVLGIDANRLMSRPADGRPETSLVIALGGRTGFDHLAIHFAIRQGRVEPVGSSLQAPRMTGQIEGLVDLSAQSHDLAMVLRRREDQPPLPSEFFAFRMEGPLLAPQFRPDSSLLARRS